MKSRGRFSLRAASQTRRTGLVTVAILALTMATALLIARTEHLGVAGTLVTVLVGGGAPAAVYLAWASYLLQAADADLKVMTDQLATSLGMQWRVEAQLRRLNEPYPLPVSWSPADRIATDSWASLIELARSGAGWVSHRFQDCWAESHDDLAGEGNELATIMRRVPTGRLVVLGEPGSGKTMLMVRLILDLLNDRSEGDPVPILVSLASWDPSQQNLNAWLLTRLTIDHPMLTVSAPNEVRARNCAEALLLRGLIEPILDGLDEIPEALRGPAIAGINDALQPGQRVVVTCRTGDFQVAAGVDNSEDAWLRGAAAVQLDSLDAAKVSRYLLDDAGGPVARERWVPILDLLGTQTPVGQALTTPLAVGLARTIYNPRPGERAGVVRDPAELCSADREDRAAVEALLLDGLIPASYRQPGRWTATQAEVWLTFLARHLERTVKSPDIAWWQLPEGAPRVVRSWLGYLLLSGVFSGVIITALALLQDLVMGYSLSILNAFELGGLLAVTAVLLAGIGRVAIFMVHESSTAAVNEVSVPDSPRIAITNFAPELSRGLHFSFRRLTRVLGTSLAICLAYCLWVNRRHESFHHLVPAIVAGVVIGLILGLPASLAGVRGDLSWSASPALVLARDRRAAVVRGLVIGLSLGLLAGTMQVAFGGPPFTASYIILTVIFLGLFGLASGLTFASLGMGLDTAWLPYTLATSWLAITGRLPWSLMSFLEDAHRRGVLRQAGALYQFRHIELQRRLAARQD